MACEICGRNSCTRSFHSVEEQEAFDNIKDKIVDNIKSKLTREVSNSIKGHYHGSNYYISIDEIIKLINDID